MGNEKAQRLDELYRAERGRLERIATLRVGPANASDVVHEVFATIWSKAKEHVKLTPAYLARATDYTAISHFRATRRRQAFLGGITEHQYAAAVATPDRIVSAREDLRRLEDAIDALPSRTRQVFLLSRMHGCTYDEIAVGLGISVSTVEREIARAILACKDRG